MWFIQFLIKVYMDYLYILALENNVMCECINITLILCFEIFVMYPEVQRHVVC